MSMSSSATVVTVGGGTPGGRSAIGTLLGGLDPVAVAGGVSRARGGDFAPRNRRALASHTHVEEVLAGVATNIDRRVTILEGAVAGLALVKTTFRLSYQDVVELGAAAGPLEVELGDLPAGSHIINALTNCSTAFTSSVPLYDLTADLVWRAKDSVAPDAIPYDVASKAAFLIGSDTAPVVQYGSFGATGLNDTPFSAGANPTRWPYTPTLVINLTAGGVGTPNLDSFTGGVLEIVVLSVTML